MEVTKRKKNWRSLKDDFPDKPNPHISKLIRKDFDVRGKILYNASRGEFIAGDMIINENHFIPQIVTEEDIEAANKEASKDKDKGYTLQPNHTTNPDVPSTIRCEFGQTVQDFANYQVVTTYYFENDFPEELKDLVREGFSKWTVASNSKFIFNEVAVGGYIRIGMRDFADSTRVALAGTPHTSLRSYQMGDVLLFNSDAFDPITGGLVGSNYSSSARNASLHEIGHILGLGHFGSGGTSSVHHINGTLTNQGQGVGNSIMFSGLTINTELFPDDINSINTLYPYNGNGSLQCNTELGYPDITSDGFYLMPALGDVNNSGWPSASDLVLIRNYILNPSMSNLNVYSIQRASAINPGNTQAPPSGTDLVTLRNHILGLVPWNIDITQQQWVALADVNSDGNLNILDKGETYFPTGGNVWSNGQISRNNFTTDAQSTCSIIDGNQSVLESIEYNFWINNIP